MMNKAIRTQLSSNPALEKLLPHIKGNVGLVFSKEDPVLVRDKLLENKVCFLTPEILSNDISCSKTQLKYYITIYLTYRIIEFKINIISQVCFMFFNVYLGCLIVCDILLERHKFHDGVCIFRFLF